MLDKLQKGGSGSHFFVRTAGKLPVTMLQAPRDGPATVRVRLGRKGTGKGGPLTGREVQARKPPDQQMGSRAAVGGPH